MPISEQLLAKIRCPSSGEKLVPADHSLIQLLNLEIQEGRLFNQLGIQWESELEEGLVNESASCFIMVRHGVPDLTPDNTIPIDHLELFEPD